MIAALLRQVSCIDTNTKLCNAESMTMTAHHFPTLAIITAIFPMAD